MPPDIEDVFAAAGLSLFPAGVRDLVMDCSCPDFEVPCKHLKATPYLLAESFDDDPFAVLTLRGRTREELLSNLGARRTGAPPGATQAEATSAGLTRLRFPRTWTTSTLRLGHRHPASGPSHRRQPARPGAASQDHHPRTGPRRPAPAHAPGA